MADRCESKAGTTEYRATLSLRIKSFRTSFQARMIDSRNASKANAWTSLGRAASPWQRQSARRRLIMMRTFCYYVRSSRHASLQFATLSVEVSKFRSRHWLSSIQKFEKVESECAILLKFRRAFTLALQKSSETPQGATPSRAQSCHWEIARLRARAPF